MTCPRAWQASSDIIDIADPDGQLQGGQAVFTFEDITSPAVVVERFFLLGGWKGPKKAFMFDNRSGKALVLRNMSMSGLLKKPSAGGECFIEDVPASGLFIGPGEKCWARQYNPESPEANMIEVAGGHGPPELGYSIGWADRRVALQHPEQRAARGTW